MTPYSKVNLEIYLPKIRVQSRGFNYESDDPVPYDDAKFKRVGILKAFLEDDDIQELTVVSTNIGFVKTFIKMFRK